MNQNKFYELIRYPVITEKSTNLSEANKYVFKVDVNSNKHQIRKAIENIFNVKVESVNIINIKGKKKRFKGRLGVRNNIKKAIISVTAGQTIDFAIGV